MSEVAGGGEPKSGTFKSTMETIYPRLSRSCNGPFTPRSVPWLGQESGWQGVGIRLIDAISRVGVCARALDYFAWKTEHSFLVLRSFRLCPFDTLSRNVNQIARRVISEDPVYQKIHVYAGAFLNRHISIFLSHQSFRTHVHTYVHMHSVFFTRVFSTCLLIQGTS